MSSAADLAAVREGLRQLLLARPGHGPRPCSWGRVMLRQLAREVTTTTRMVRQADLASERHCAGQPLPPELIDLLDGGIPVDRLAGGHLRLPSPCTGRPVACVASLRGAENTNFLWFVDGEQSFVVLQKTTSSDALYLPREDLLISFDHFGSLRVGDVGMLYQLLARHTESLVALLAGLARGEPGFSLAGVLATHPRPGHHYHEVMPALTAVAACPGVPAVGLLQGADFLPQAWLARWLAPRPVCLMDGRTLNEVSLARRQWWFYAGRSRYRQPMRALRRGAEVAWTRHALSWVAAQPPEGPHWAQGAPRLAAAQRALAGCTLRVWVGLDGGQSAWVGQAEALAALVQAVLALHPGAGVVFDGWTSPCTPSTTRSAVLDRDRALLRAVRARCPAWMPFADLVGADSLTKLALGSQVDFFITNHTSGSLHVSRLLAKPGVTHLPPGRTAWSLASEHQTHPHQRVQLLPPSLYRRVPPVAEPLRSVGRQLRRLGLRAAWADERYRLDPGACQAWLTDRLAALTEPARPLYFLEPPASVNPEIRPYLQRASHHRCVWHFPEVDADAQANLSALVTQAGEQADHLVLYGRGSMEALAQCLPGLRLALWLDEPLAVLQRLAAQRQAALHATGQPFDLAAYVANSCELDNPLTRWLSGQRCARGQVSDAMREQASQRLADAVFIGLVADLADAVARLGQVLGWHRQAFPDDLGMLDWPSLAPVLDATQLAELAALNQHDLLLYRQALSRRAQLAAARSPTRPPP